jgi:hypothetical protein
MFQSHEKLGLSRAERNIGTNYRRDEKKVAVVMLTDASCHEHV